MSELESESLLEDQDEIKLQLIELYLNVKIRSKDEISDFSEENLVEEKDRLLEASIQGLINYIKTSIEILMNLKVEEYLELKKKQKREKNLEQERSQDSARISTEPPQDYEEVIQKFEGDVRKHIRIEQQMKIHSDNLQQKLEDTEKETLKVENKIQRLKEDHERENKMLNLLLDKKEKEIKYQKRVIDKQSKEIMDLETQLPLPNTSKSFMDKRNSSNKSRLETTHIK